MEARKPQDRRIRRSDDPLRPVREFVASPEMMADALRTARRFRSNPEDAADIVSEAILKATRSIHTYDSRLKFTAWMTRIIQNTAKDELRRRQNKGLDKVVGYSDHCSLADAGEGSIEGMVEAHPDPVDCYAHILEGAPPDREVEGSVVASDRIAIALSRLPRLHREALMMFADGSSYDEIALEMELPVARVRMAVSTAQELMRGMLGE